MHTTGGYLTQVAYTHKYVFDLKPDTDVYWCTADVGWVTGHSYIVYGPLANRATSVLYEGTPDHPGKDRLWSIVEKYKVTIFYTAPTAIRTFMKWGDELPAAHDLSSLRLIGTVGEPINPEAWVWYYGVDRRRDVVPVVDTWWQTETGAIMISALPGATTLKPGSATFPLPGIEAGIVDDAGKPPSVSRAAATSCCRGRGRRCCAGSGATRSVTATRTGRGSATSTSPATAPSATTTATSGCSVASTTSCSSPATTSRPPRWSRRWSTTRRSRRPRSSAATTRRPGRRSPRSSRCAAASNRATSSSRSCATTSRNSSGRSRSRRRSCSPRSCRRRGRARSCAGCCATSPRTSCSATRPRSPIPTVVDGIKSKYLASQPPEE